MYKATCSNHYQIVSNNLICGYALHQEKNKQEVGNQFNVRLSSMLHCVGCDVWMVCRTQLSWWEGWGWVNRCKSPQWRSYASCRFKCILWLFPVLHHNSWECQWLVQKFKAGLFANGDINTKKKEKGQNCECHQGQKKEETVAWESHLRDGSERMGRDGRGWGDA